MKLLTPLFLLAAALGATVSNGPAQTGSPYDLIWSTLDGGGGSSSGGAYAITGTIGQPDAGQLAGGAYTLSGGFWPAFQTDDNPPSLTLNRSGADVVVKWPFSATDFVLQQANALASPAAAILWTDLAAPAAIHVGSEWMVTIPSLSDSRFFRLRKP